MKKRIRCAAVVPAAGMSSRMQGINKLFYEVCGMPVIVITLKALQSSELIDEIVVSARESDISDISRLCAEYGIAHLARAAAQSLRRDVPKDLAICCFDEKYGYQGEYFFTHIKQDETGIAHNALDILENMLADKNMRRQTRQIPVALMEGRST